MRTISLTILFISMLLVKSAHAIGFTIAASIAALTAAGALTGAGLAVGAGITAATIGLGAYAVKKLTAQPKSAAAPAALPAAPSVDTAALAAKESVDKKRRAVARNQTNFTSPLGLKDEDKSNIALKTLTGA